MHKTDVFFGIHFDLHAVAEDTVLGADITAENIRAFLEAVKPEYVTWDCKGHPGYAGYPTRIGTPAPGIVKDALAVWREVTKEKGVLFGVHYSGVVDEAAVARHPEWARVTPEGQTDLRTTSTFGKYVDELLLPQLKEIIDQYDVDYVWLDGECWGAALDYSSEALCRWTLETGLQDAPRAPGESHWTEWKEFNRRSFERYLCHWTEELLRYNGRVCPISNWAYTTMMPKDILAPVQMISGDYDPNISLDRARIESRYLQNTGLPWELMAWGFDTVANYDEMLKPPVQTMQEASVVLSHGGAFMIYYLPTRAGYLDEVITDYTRQLAEFCLKRRECCFGSRPVKQVAVIYSTATQMDKSNCVYSWGDALLKNVEGALQALLELHYSCDVLSEHQILDHMSEYPYIVLPDGYGITETFKNALLTYVENGGSLLIADGRTSLRFEEVLGVEIEKIPVEKRSTISVNGKKVSDRGGWYKVFASSAEVLFHRYIGEGPINRLSSIDVREEDVSDAVSSRIEHYPAVTVSRYGKGLIAAMFGDYARQYYDHHHPFARKMFHEISNRLFPDPAVTVQAPPTVDVSLRRSASGQLQVHLVNTTCMAVSDRRPYCDYIPEVQDIRVTVKTEDIPKAVRWEPDGEMLSFIFDSGYTTVNVPTLSLHGVVEFVL